MKLLLDTHIAFWAVFARHRLLHGEREVLNRDDVEIIVSAISIWELRLKWNSFHLSGDRKGPADPIEALTFFRQLGLRILPLEPELAATPLRDPMPHKDPFDELLLVHAQELGVKLLTRDRRLRDHPLAYSAQ